MGATMIKAIRFKNYKALRDTMLPLGRVTVLVGPNGSGKSTALEGLNLGHGTVGPSDVTAGIELVESNEISIEIEWETGARSKGYYTLSDSTSSCHVGEGRAGLSDEQQRLLNGIIGRTRVYSLDAGIAGEMVQLQPNLELSSNGRGLAGVLDRLRDQYPERFESLNEEFGRWIPEFDRVLFDTPVSGHRGIKLRTRIGHHQIPAGDVSHGTLLALAILTLAYLPQPPPVLGLEEPGAGLHPRLLRDVRDAMYRLAYPENFGEKRDPVQVVATTHSPYMLDQFREHPEEIVIASKLEDNVRFQPLTDMPNIDEILESAPLGEVWYSGILGGVPAGK